MPNVKISKKGKALLKNRELSVAIAKAIVKGGNKLYSEGGIEVKIENGNPIVVKGSQAAGK